MTGLREWTRNLVLTAPLVAGTNGSSHALEKSNTYGSALLGQGRPIAGLAPATGIEILSVEPYGRVAVSMAPWGTSRTFGAQSGSDRGESIQHWIRVNDRRCHLIRKKHLAPGLTSAESEELDRLQGDMARHVDALAPLPWAELEKLEKSLSELRNDQRT